MCKKNNGGTTKMLYLGLIFDIRKKQIHSPAMAVRKNRTYKAHDINTIYLHITFKIQLALILELCNMSIKDTI